MKIMLACLADFAKADAQGKLDVTGVFDTLWAKEFPTRHPQMFLVIRLKLESEDGGKKQSLDVKLRDADNRERARIHGEVACAPIPAGEFGVQNILFGMQNITFEKPGDFHFAFFVDGVEIAEHQVALALRVKR